MNRKEITTINTSDSEKEIIRNFAGNETIQ